MSAAVQIARLARAFPRQEIRQETFQVYVDDLREIPSGTLDPAVTDLIRTSQFFPTIAEIRRACAERVACLPTEQDALAQLDAFLADRDLEPHPLVRKAMTAQGGLRAYRSSTEPDRWRTQFARCYRACRDDAIHDTQLQPSLGAATSTEIATSKPAW